MSYYIKDGLLPLLPDWFPEEEVYYYDWVFLNIAVIWGVILAVHATYIIPS